MSLKDSYAIVTGATSGIGSAFAEHLASMGYNLIITGRRIPQIHAVAQQLQDQYNIEIKVLILDFNNPKDLKDFCTYIKSLPRVSFLVNNAGFGCSKSFFEDTYENQHIMLKVHIDAVCRITHSVVPIMKRAQSGYIINVASLGAFFPAPESELYASTKSFIISFSESISLGLKKYNIKVKALCPGFTISDFHERLGKKNALLLKQGLIPWMTSEEVVKTSFKSLDSSKTVIIPGTFNKTLVIFKHLIPKKLYNRAALHLNKR